MDFSPFKQDIDDLIKEFSERELKSFSDLKRLWLDRKFSYIFEVQPPTSLTVFVQFLYSHCISYLIPTNTLSQRLGALYILYCLYEAQPFKAPFKIYLSLGELRRLRALVVNAKEKRIKVVSVLVRRMLEKNAFLFGFVNINDYSEKERIKELVEVQNACINKMHETHIERKIRLLANSELEKHLHMDLGMELDQDVLKKMFKEYEGTKTLAIREASQSVDVKDIKNIVADDKETIGDQLHKINEEWINQKEMFSQLIRTQQSVVTHPKSRESHHEQPMEFPATEQQSDEELQHTGFMDLLFGNELPLGNDDDLEYQLFGGML